MFRFQTYLHKKPSRGFTLIEAIVSIGIMLLLGGGMIALQRAIFTNTRVLQSSLISQQEARRTLQSFVAELRSSTASANGSFAIESVGTSSIVFFSNIDTDPLIERVRYYLATTTKTSGYNALNKGVTKPTGTVYNTALEKISRVVSDIRFSTSTPIFTYYDSNYNGTASSTAPLPYPVSIPEIRLVRIAIPVDPNAARSPVFQTYTTQVSIRNLKDNL